ncbi:hypothetical protein CDD81_3866 [Ophiocordyceps australis]|uniref:Cns1/TTC4 wheel domain-containing protein n=1 Tax=Ophiocordyceps australis TaxID=1399860 RepID=A0A2C5YBG7_9HYPO|nr:hypothetical protein CDD81_3866 [Ophiocordyceps australis]
MEQVSDLASKMHLESSTTTPPPPPSTATAATSTSTSTATATTATTATATTATATTTTTATTNSSPKPLVHPTPPPRPPTKTVDQVWAELNSCPLFMTEMEPNNDDIAALQALSYEGTRLSVSLDMRERGNECFGVGGYVDAQEFYTKGVQVLTTREEDEEKKGGKEKGDDEKEEEKEEEEKEEKKMLEILLVNRAACHFALRNYRSAWLDCAAALRCNARNVKALFRAARALLAVERVDEAQDACLRGIEVARQLVEQEQQQGQAASMDNKDKDKDKDKDKAKTQGQLAALESLAAQISDRATALDTTRRTASARHALAARRARLVAAALAARNIPTRRTAQRPLHDAVDAAIALVPDPDDAHSALAFPTLLLYPLRLESDFIRAVVESDCLASHLAYILPPPWDTPGPGGPVYTPQSVSCYLETRNGGLLKLGKRVPLLKALSTGSVQILDQLLRIFVVPTSEADGWVAKHKAQRAAN